MSILFGSTIMPSIPFLYKRNVFDSFENVTVRALPRRISKISVDLLWEELVEAKKGSDSEEVLSITQYIFSRAKKDGLLSCILQIAERYISECDSLCLTGGVFDCSDIFYKYEVTQKDIKMLDFPGPSDEKDLTVL